MKISEPIKGNLPHTIRAHRHHYAASNAAITLFPPSPPIALTSLESIIIRQGLNLMRVSKDVRAYPDKLNGAQVPCLR